MMQRSNKQTRKSASDRWKVNLIVRFLTSNITESHGDFVRCYHDCLTLSNVGGLMVDGYENIAGCGVESGVGVVVADPFHGFSDDALMVDGRLGRDLAEDHHHSRLYASLAGDLRVRIHLYVRDLIRRKMRDWAH